MKRRDKVHFLIFALILTDLELIKFGFFSPQQKSSLGENWPSPAVKLQSSASSNELGGMKYVVYKQPLSLDRFFIHEVSNSEANVSKLENSFILINLNRFQQIVSVQTFQAESEQSRVSFYQLFVLIRVSCLFFFLFAE